MINNNTSSTDEDAWLGIRHFLNQNYIFMPAHEDSVEKIAEEYESFVSKEFFLSNINQIHKSVSTQVLLNSCANIFVYFGEQENPITKSFFKMFFSSALLSAFKMRRFHFYYNEVFTGVFASMCRAKGIIAFQLKQGNPFNECQTGASIFKSEHLHSNEVCLPLLLYKNSNANQVIPVVFDESSKINNEILCSKVKYLVDKQN